MVRRKGIAQASRFQDFPHNDPAANLDGSSQGGFFGSIENLST
jgi:hypothetical protein